MDGDAGGVINREALRGYVSRVAHLHDERDELNADIREVYREAKNAGFDTTVLREIVREYRTDAEPRQSRYALLDAYRSALGMLAGTPLGDYYAGQDPRRFNNADEAMLANIDTDPPIPPEARRRRGRPRKIDEAIDHARDLIGNGPDWAA